MINLIALFIYLLGTVNSVPLSGSCSNINVIWNNNDVASVNTINNIANIDRICNSSVDRFNSYTYNLGMGEKFFVSDTHKCINPKANIYLFPVNSIILYDKYGSYNVNSKDITIINEIDYIASDLKYKGKHIFGMALTHEIFHLCSDSFGSRLEINNRELEEINAELFVEFYDRK